MTLGDWLREPAITIDRIAERLDSLDHAGRMQALGKATPAEQQKLWLLALQAPPVTFEDFVPADVPDVTAVIHHGRNTMPLEGLRTFQKIFARARGTKDKLYGFNEGKTRPWLGPGCFTVRTTAGNAKEEKLGAIVVDYYLTPDGDVPAAWPAPVSASRGISWFVYGYTRDYMRKVSRHVTIGRGFKWNIDVGALFLLIREDVGR